MSAANWRPNLLNSHELLSVSNPLQFTSFKALIWLHMFAVHTQAYKYIHVKLCETPKTLVETHTHCVYSVHLFKKNCEAFLF